MIITSKFKIGDKVKLNKGIEDFTYGRGFVSYEEVGTIKKIIYDGINWDYDVNFKEARNWRGTENELVLAEKNSKDFSKDDLRVRISCKT